MTTTKIASLTFTFASVLAAAGCNMNASGSASGAMTSEDYDDVAVAVGSLVAGSASAGGETGAMADSMDSAEGTLEADTTAEGSLGGTAEVVVRGGLRFEYQASCFDLEGVALAACDGSADSAEIAVDWSGSLDGPRYQATVSRTGTWSLVGLQGETAELNGAGSFELQSHFEALYRPVSRDLALAYDAEYDAVLIDTETRQTVGGTIRYSLEGQRTVVRDQVERRADIAVEAAVTFQADGTAALVLDGARSYVIELASGEIIAEGGARLSIGADQ